MVVAVLPRHENHCQKATPSRNTTFHVQYSIREVADTNHKCYSHLPIGCLHVLCRCFGLFLRRLCSKIQLRSQRHAWRSHWYSRAVRRQRFVHKKIVHGSHVHGIRTSKMFTCAGTHRKYLQFSPFHNNTCDCQLIEPKCSLTVAMRKRVKSRAIQLESANLAG